MPAGARVTPNCCKTAAAGESFGISGDASGPILARARPSAAIGVETRDLFLRIGTDKGTASIDGVAHRIKGGDCLIVPAGAVHNVTNSGKKTLRFYTLCAPSEHMDGLEQRTKAAAETADEGYDGVATE